MIRTDILRVRILKMKKTITTVIIAYTLMLLIFTSCMSMRQNELRTAVDLSFLQTCDMRECYYLDDFMPTPDSLTAGKSGGLYTRHYNYTKAVYHDNLEGHIILSFYSPDKSCWTLFRESILPL